MANKPDCCEVRYMSTDIEIFGMYNTGDMTLVSCILQLNATQVQTLSVPQKGVHNSLQFNLIYCWLAKYLVLAVVHHDV